MRAHSLALFAQIGAWVATTSPGELQRLFAEACHRHAWHAELWEARAPTIPTATHANVAAVCSAVTRATTTTRAASATARNCRRSRTSFASLRSRIDPALDPSTARTIDLVGRDVVEIAERLDALRTR